MRNVAASMVCATCFVAALSGCGRANPRLAKLERIVGDAVVTTTFTYDKAGHPTNVVIAGALLTQSLTLAYDGAHLVKVTTANEPNGLDPTVEVTTVKYDANHLVGADTTVANGARAVAISYDGDKITKVVNTSTFDQREDTVTTTITYGDSGVAKSVAKHTSTGQPDSTENSTFKYEGGHLSEIADDGDSGEDDLHVLYANGVVDEIDIAQTFSNGDVAKTTRKFVYEGAGRVARVTDTSEVEGADVNTTFTYDDGDAADIDVTPAAPFPFGLFDLKGASFGTLDARTQAARLAGAVW